MPAERPATVLVRWVSRDDDPGARHADDQSSRLLATRIDLSRPETLCAWRPACQGRLRFDPVAPTTRASRFSAAKAWAGAYGDGRQQACRLRVRGLGDVPVNRIAPAREQQELGAASRSCRPSSASPRRSSRRRRSLQAGRLVCVSNNIASSRLCWELNDDDPAARACRYTTSLSNWAGGSPRQPLGGCRAATAWRARRPCARRRAAWTPLARLRPEAGRGDTAPESPAGTDPPVGDDDRAGLDVGHEERPQRVCGRIDERRHAEVAEASGSAPLDGDAHHHLLAHRASATPPQLLADDVALIDLHLALNEVARDPGARAPRAHAVW